MSDEKARHRHPRLAHFGGGDVIALDAFPRDIEQAAVEHVQPHGFRQRRPRRRRLRAQKRTRGKNYTDECSPSHHASSERTSDPSLGNLVDAGRSADVVCDVPGTFELQRNLAAYWNRYRAAGRTSALFFAIVVLLPFQERPAG
jgi:hypothetical protein